MNIDLLSAFLIGLLGSGHCLGMCGGITSMLTSATGQSNSDKFPFVLSYNLGRILSYTFFGALAGLTGSLALKSMGFPLTILRIFSSVFMIFLGLYISQWSMLLSHFEKIGKGLWQFVSPLSKKVLPVTTIPKALMLGLIWGWLPCGLVYSTLTWSIASGSATNGALIMACFGLGTLPALFTLSFGQLKIMTILKNHIFRKVIGSLMICYGFYGLYLAYGALF